MEKMRATYRCSRRSSTKHNERDFDIERTDYINTSKTKDNVYVTWREGEDCDLSGAELAFYKERYQPALDAQNARHAESRHWKRIKSIDEWLLGKKEGEDRRPDPKRMPEEVLLQVGNIKHSDKIDESEFIKCVGNYVGEMEAWSNEHGNHLHFLDVAIHFDEATPHAQLRRVWDYVDTDGLIKPGQEKALEQSGVELPYPDNQIGRYNNRKISFDDMMREKWQDILESHGFEIERTPRPGKQYHEKKGEFIRKQEEEREKKAIELDKWESRLEKLDKSIEARNESSLDREYAVAKKEKALGAKERELQVKLDSIAEKETLLDSLVKNGYEFLDACENLTSSDKAEEFIQEKGLWDQFTDWLRNKVETVMKKGIDFTKEAEKTIRRLADESEIEDRRDSGPDRQF